MTEKTSRSHIGRIVFFVLTIAVMVTIFIFSSQNAQSSSRSSGRITKVAVRLIDKDYDNRPPKEQKKIWNKASFYVRKTAHFSIYALLGLCASLAVGRRKLFTLKSLGVVAFGAFYAFSDELHQKFSEGRSCEFRDMMIDTGGVLLGMILSLVIMSIVACFVKGRKHKKA